MKRYSDQEAKEVLGTSLHNVSLGAVEQGQSGPRWIPWRPDQPPNPDLGSGSHGSQRSRDDPKGEEGLRPQKLRRHRGRP